MNTTNRTLFVATVFAVLLAGTPAARSDAGADVAATGINADPIILAGFSADVWRRHPRTAFPPDDDLRAAETRRLTAYERRVARPARPEERAVGSSDTGSSASARKLIGGCGVTRSDTVRPWC